MARKVQSYIRRFLASTSASDFPTDDWPLYGEGAETLDIQENGFEIMTDPLEVSGACKLLRDVARDPANGA